MVTWWHGDMVIWGPHSVTYSMSFNEVDGAVVGKMKWQNELVRGGERLHDRWRHLDGSKSDVSHVSSVKYSRQCWAAQCPMSAERCRKLRGSSHHGTLFIAASKILGPSTGLARDIIKTCQELPSNVSERNSFLKISHPSSSPVLVSFFLWTKAEDIKIQDTKSVAFNLNFVVICSLHGAPCQGRQRDTNTIILETVEAKMIVCPPVYRCTGVQCCTTLQLPDWLSCTTDASVRGCWRGPSPVVKNKTPDWTFSESKIEHFPAFTLFQETCPAVEV